jgi:hypothetical protein
MVDVSILNDVIRAINVTNPENDGDDDNFTTLIFVTGTGETIRTQILTGSVSGFSSPDVMYPIGGYGTMWTSGSDGTRSYATLNNTYRDVHIYSGDGGNNLVNRKSWGSRAPGTYVDRGLLIGGVGGAKRVHLIQRIA